MMELNSLLGLVEATGELKINDIWCLDVAFREDDSRIRSGHAPENMTLIHTQHNLVSSP